MHVSSENPTNIKFFESFRICFRPHLELKFNLFDFPLAQKWASLLAAQLPISPGICETTVNRLSRDELQDRLDIALLSVFPDHSYSELLRSLEREGGVFTMASIEKILSYEPNLPEGTDQLSERIKNLKEAAKRLKAGRENKLRSGMRIRIRAPETKVIGMPLEFQDFNHFQIGRMPGGVRLSFIDTGKTAMECAKKRLLSLPPTPMRQFGADFRLDLATRYPGPESWADYHELLAWAEETGFDLSHKYNWADQVYVARLCDDDMNRQSEILKQISSCSSLETVEILLEAADMRSVRSR